MGKTNFFDFFFHWGIRNKSWEKTRIFRYGLPEDFLSKGQKPQGGLEGQEEGPDLIHEGN